MMVMMMMMMMKKMIQRFKFFIASLFESSLSNPIIFVVCIPLTTHQQNS